MMEKFYRAYFVLFTLVTFGRRMEKIDISVELHLIQNCWYGREVYPVCFGGRLRDFLSPSIAIGRRGRLGMIGLQTSLQSINGREEIISFPRYTHTDRERQRHTHNHASMCVCHYSNGPLPATHRQKWAVNVLSLSPQFRPHWDVFRVGFADIAECNICMWKYLVAV